MLFQSYQLIKFRLIISCMVCFFSINLDARQLAFPGAEGFGQYTSGGRGGIVLEVTNLNDTGDGSLRKAIESEGCRTIVFRVSGTIELQSALRIVQGNLTIAGQTAPGDGICIRNFPLIIEADNVIVRFLRLGLGDVYRQEEDALTSIFQKNIIIDHCSISWGIDETATVRDNVNSTMQWCIISESLHRSFHKKGDHGYGGIWGGKGATFHHNLIAHNASRNPRFHGSRYHHEPDSEIVDFRNNVIYNWGFNSAYGGEGGQHNLIGNYYKSGPGSIHKNRIVEPWDSTSSWYIAENFVTSYPEVSKNNWAGGVQGKYVDNITIAEKPFNAPKISTETAAEAFEKVLAYAGAIYPKRDPVDQRIIYEVRSGTAGFGDSYGPQTGIIDSQLSVGGWPKLHTAVAPADQDHDGMADDWEINNHLDPANPADRNEDNNGDGYTNLENYLNSLCE